MRATLGELVWHARVRDFYAAYRSQTPLFTEIGGAFIDYLHEADLDAPWQLELAHYEWIEAQLFLSADEAFTQLDTADLLEGEPTLSCLARILAYRWPVDRIGPGYQPSAPPASPTLLLVYRDQHLQVRFAGSPQWPTSYWPGSTAAGGSACRRWATSRFRRRAWRCSKTCTRSSLSSP